LNLCRIDGAFESLPEHHSSVSDFVLHAAKQNGLAVLAGPTGAGVFPDFASALGEMAGWHPVAQIRREQQWSGVIDIFETRGHELLVALPRPITGSVSKMPQAFSFSSLS
jgi:hypothetical protein